MLIDTHCHLNALSKPLQEEIISAAGNRCFFDSSIDLNSSLVSLELSRCRPGVHSCLGFHPFSLKDFDGGTLACYAKMIKENKVAALGEIGLDVQAPASLAEQEKVFGLFIGLAKDCGLPITVHNRGCPERALEILDQFYSSYENVIFHCFSYRDDFLKKIIDKGGYASFSLNILRRKGEILDSLKACPPNNLLFETDAPYMKINGNPSTPLDIKAVYDFAAGLRGIRSTAMEETVARNVSRVLKV